MAELMGPVSDFEQQQLDLMQRKKRAIEGQKFNAPQGQMVSGHYVAPHWTQILAEGLRGYSDIQGEKQATEQLKDLQGKRQTAIADALRNFGEKSQGAPAFEAAGPMQPSGAPLADPLGLEGGKAAPSGGYTVPARAPDLRGAYADLMAAPDAALRNAGMQGIIQMPQLEAARLAKEEERQFRRDESALARQARMDALAQQHQDRMAALEAQNATRQQMAQEQRQFQMQMAQMNLANRPEKNLTVMGPNGEAITMPQSQAQGMQLYNPQAATQLQKSKTKAEAKDQLSGVVQQLSNSYNALEEGGGITSTAQGGMANLGARLGSTALGQAVGGALGTQNQRQRQEIEQTRPLLLNLIKEATGMSAQQMNSNAEMQLYLKAATDPTLTVEANRSALANLDKMFGLGLAKPPADAAKPPAGGANSQDAAALQWARSNPSDPRSRAILQRLGQ